MDALKVEKAQAALDTMPMAAVRIHFQKVILRHRYRDKPIEITRLQAANAWNNDDPGECNHGDEAEKST